MVEWLLGSSFSGAMSVAVLAAIAEPSSESRTNVFDAN
jgi:hypothetical protein